MWKKIKLSAKETLKDNWLESIFAISMPIFVFIIQSLLATIIDYSMDFAKHINLPSETIEMIFNCVQILLIMVTIFYLSTLFFGIIKYFWNKSFNKNDLQLMFYPFKKGSFSRYSAIANFHFCSYFFCLLIPLIIIYITVMTMIDPNISYSFFENINIYGLIAIISLSILALYLILVLLQGHSLLPYILLSDEKISYSSALKLSRKIMRGNKINSANFILSFMPLFLLCILIVPIIYVVPYYLQCRCEYSKEVLNSLSNKTRANENNY